MKSLFCAMMAASLAVAVHASNLRLWYVTPGSNSMTQGLLIGNGRMGAAIPGGVAKDIIVLNEDSLWSGTENLSGGYSTGPNGAFGSYQMFGSLVLNLPAHTNYTGYVRALHIETGIATMDYTNDGVGYHREVFCSNPDQVLVMRLTADTPASYTGSIQLVDSHSATTIGTTNGLMFAGALANSEQYEAQMVAINNGGTLVSSGGVVNFTNCNSLTILVALGTDYVMDYARNYHGNNPHSNVLAQVAAASAKSFSTLETAHTNDFESLFNRVSIWLGNAPASRTNLPTDQRVTANAIRDDDPGMEQLMFQYGRYLMISGSRGALPMNLQGLWNDNNDPSWASDYHSDINVQMMYWEVEVANLPECFLPFVNWLQSQIPAWRYGTTNVSTSINNGGYGFGYGGTNGWTTRTSHNIYGGQGWEWVQSGNAWYCMHLWEHYAFTGNTNYLLSVYPILRETCQFWQQHLQLIGPNTNGLPITTLIATNGWSPEHPTTTSPVPRENGVSFDQELIWDVFNNYQQACAVLNTDAVYSATVSNLQANLLVPGIGPWGELREWLYSADSQSDHHRHTSHLVGVYPGHQFTPDQTPALAAAAKVGLLARGDTGDSAAEWADVWRTALFARLHDPVDAHYKLTLYCGSIYPNLVANLGTVQWDGSCGVTAAIAEMLLQSDEGRIDLLPALPTNWPCGSVSGLCARGGFAVDMAWTNGWLTSATIHSADGTNCIVQYGGQTFQTNMALGGSVVITPQIPPNAPTGVFANPGNGQVTVGWNITGGATSYNVMRSTTSASGYVPVANVTGTTFVNTGLANGTKYYYVVAAVNSFGQSANSAEVSASPDARYTTGFYWSGAVNGSWNTSTVNWQSDGASLAFADGHDVIFDDTTLSNTTVTLSAPRTPASVTVNNSSLNFSFGGSAIAGMCGLTKFGSGTLTLLAANTYSGGTVVNNGTLAVGSGAVGTESASALGTGLVTVNTGAIVDFAPGNTSTVFNFTNSFAVNGGTVMGYDGVQDVARGAGATTNIGEWGATFDAWWNGKDMYLNGQLTGSGPMTIRDGNADARYSGGVVYVTGSRNTYKGTVTVQSGGYLGIGDGNALSSSTIINNSSGNNGNSALTTASGLIFYSGSANVTSASLGSLAGYGNIILQAGTGANSKAVNLTVGGNNADSTCCGVISGSGSLTKSGTGTFKLTGASCYSGATTVSNGELVVSSAFSGNGNVFVAGGTVFGVTNLSSMSALVSNLTVAAGARLEFQNVTSTTMPLISVSNATFNGKCIVKITGSNGLAEGGSFPLVNYGGALSGFGNLQLQMPYGWRAKLATNASQLVLANVAEVATTPPRLGFGLTNAMLQINWPSDHIGWRLLMSRDLTSSVWADESSNLVMTTNQVILPVVTGNSSIYYRLAYP